MPRSVYCKVHQSLSCGRLRSGTACRGQSIPVSALRAAYAEPPAAALLTGQTVRELASAAARPLPGTLSFLL